MPDRFFYEQMVNMMCSPLYIYNIEGKLLDKIGGDDKDWWIWLGYDKAQTLRLLMERKDYPVLYTGKQGYTAAILYSENKNVVLAAGPVMLAPAEENKDETKGKKRFLVEKKEDIPAGCSLSTFVSGCLLLYWKLTGREMPVSELWKCNNENYAKIRQIQKRLSEDMFFRQENFGKHNPGEQELRELESIENGDKEALSRSISETYEGSIGILAKDPLRHYKNVAIGNITLASRAAIRGGVSLKGEMSMVGPRPERPEIMEMYIKELPEFKQRLCVKAGLTGYAQVCGTYYSTPREKLEMDMEYLEKASLTGDLIIILATAGKLLFGEKKDYELVTVKAVPAKRR